MAAKRIIFLSLMLNAHINSMMETKIHLPLHNAILQDNVALLQEHLKRPDVDVNETDVNGNTALHRAAEKLDTKSIVLLLKHNALLLKNKDNKTPTSLFLNALIYTKKPAILSEFDCLKRLICKTPNINEQHPENGTTVAHRILANTLLFDGMLQLVEILDAACADWNLRNKNGNTPLHSFLIAARPLVRGGTEWVIDKFEGPVAFDRLNKTIADVIQVLDKKTHDAPNDRGETIEKLKNTFHRPLRY